MVIADRVADEEGEAPGGGKPLTGDGVIQAVGFAFVMAEVASVGGGPIQDLHISGGIDGDQTKAANVMKDSGCVGLAAVLAGPIGDFRGYYSSRKIVPPTTFEGGDLQRIPKIAAKGDGAGETFHLFGAENGEGLQDAADFAAGARVEHSEQDTVSAGLLYARGDRSHRVGEAALGSWERVDLGSARYGTEPVLRACITSYRTGPADVAALVRELEEVCRD